MKDLNIELLEAMSTISTMDAMDIRNFMADKGWHSNDRLSNMGWGDTVGYSIWFYRWDWHGIKTAVVTGDKVSFHDGTNDLSNLDSTVRMAAKRALQAYALFPDSIPYQNINGEVVER